MVQLERITTRTTTPTKRGTAFRHIIAKTRGTLREYSLHATKGYRSTRLEG